MKIIASFLVAGLLLAGFTDAAIADEHADARTDEWDLGAWIDQHAGAEWSGPAELWIDPTGNEALTSGSRLRVVEDGIEYTWSFRGEKQLGRIRLHDGVLRWQDSWHQPDGVDLEPVKGHGALMAGEYSYPAGAGPDWHWRIKLVVRPDDTPVLQMINIAPWGEEARAVRMVLETRAEVD